MATGAARAIPPTTATGLKQGVSVPTAGSNPGQGEGVTAVPKRSRPAAPEIFLGHGEGAEPERLAATKVITKTTVTCNQCGAESPRSYRFCISCGTVISGERTAPKYNNNGGGTAVPRPSARAGNHPSGTQPPAAAKQLASTVDHSAGAAQAAAADADPRSPFRVEGGLFCRSCHSTVVDGEVFCKRCGAALSEEAVRRVITSIPPGPRISVVPNSLDTAPPAPVNLMHKLAGDGEPFPLAKSAVQGRPTDLGSVQAREEVTGKLVVIVEDGSEGRAVELYGQQMDLGASEGDIVLSEDRYLSPRHARFFRKEQCWYLRDLGSLNGVYRRLRKAAVLQHGDLVLLGLEVLAFDLVDHAERGLGHAIQKGVLVFGSPATERRARLCQRTVEGVVRDVYHLVADLTIIGRETGDIVFTADPFMSRRHASVSYNHTDDGYVLTDLDSSNGTYLAIRDDVRLMNGDYIRLGQHLFRVDLPTDGAHRSS